ncbi:hypothetical protein R1sor_012110 [Riccia sorocarpa]|uniref:WD repeat-containing protein 76 n=1 Tax=Riccia sorocarpa TaxID=122646 RepID=A0ABD3I4Q9_9MARC
MEETFPTFSREERRPRWIESKSYQDGKDLLSAAAVAPQVKLEPSGEKTIDLQKGVLHVVINIPEADALVVPDDLKSIQQQQRTSDMDDRSKALVPVFPQVLTPAEKEECQNIELMSLENSSLVKLKRKIRLRLLAEEARNSAAKKAGLVALQDDIPFPVTRSAAKHAAAVAAAAEAAKHQHGLSKKEEDKPIPSRSTTPKNRVVYLSSESEDEGEGHAPAAGVKTPDEDLRRENGYNHGIDFETVFKSFHSPGDSRNSPLDDMSDTTAATVAAVPGPKRRPGRPPKTVSTCSNLPAGRKVPDSVSSLVKMLRKEAAVSADDSSSKRRKNETVGSDDSVLEYEQERADNIRKNKEFLAQVGLSSTLNGMAPVKSGRGRKPGSKNRRTIAKEFYEKHHNVEEIMLQNREILERRAAALASLAGGKRSRLSDSDSEDEDDEDEQEDQSLVSDSTLGADGKRQKRNPRSSKQKILEQLELHKPVESRAKTRLRKSKKQLSFQPSPSGKHTREMEKLPQVGRRRSIPASVINGLTASNKELIKLVQELMGSAASSFPKSLLESSGVEIPACDNSEEEPETPPKDITHQEDDSQVIIDDSRRKRKDTWLTCIPFETPKTTYELERDNILRRQKDQFGRLGIVSELIEEPQPSRATRPYCKRWASEPDPEYQRNTRLKDQKRKASAQQADTALRDNIALAGTRSLLEVRSLSCASSLVAKFCDGCHLDTGHAAARASKTNLGMTDQEITGFRGEDGPWFDPNLARIYTMDIAPVSGCSQKKGLLAAGGSQGRLAVFAVCDNDVASSSSKDAQSAAVSKTPLLSWTVDSSWVSQVIFLSNQFQEDGTLLLSSSNDGRVVLWDINKQRIRSGTRGLSPLTREGTPVVVCETFSLHSSGIFGMHESAGKIATSSEGSLAISTIKETGIVMERLITGHHAGVIRSVRFREQNILADCGVDTVIGILDLRASDPCSLKIQTAHKTGISMVEWSPVSVETSLVLSASKDPQLYLHDIRYPTKAMMQFEGHIHPRRAKCYSIYRPAFIAGGDAVVTPGEGTHQLSLYSVTKGEVLKKFHVGYDANALLWNNTIPKSGGLWAACRGITKVQALWQERIDV